VVDACSPRASGNQAVAEQDHLRRSRICFGAQSLIALCPKAKSWNAHEREVRT
jgi:hypothetical protein